MKRALPSQHQRGATLVVGLIMLVVITLMVTSAFTLSGSNLKAVANMQFRNEAIAAVNSALEQVIGSPFDVAPAAQEINVDINKDGTTDYMVQIAAPTCVRVSQAAGSVDPGGECITDLGGNLICPNNTPPSIFNTIWDFDATVTDARSGTQIRVHQGVNKSSGSPPPCP